MAILRYLPLIIGLAGNVGIQSSTILVRGFATGEVEPEREARVLFSEFAVGTTVGLLCGLTTTVVASVMQDGAALTVFGVAVGTAVFVSVTWAALLGCVVPITCRRSGFDPAIVAGPFLICLQSRPRGPRRARRPRSGQAWPSPSRTRSCRCRPTHPCPAS